ncbi:hypothetical protein [Micromonospora sp. CPCC 206061]|uniref:hypothetical protein n=1 Tax=Micromonospora sp. CPCC 206061 TaxID=3122410 RepID=UPI002FEEDC05
MLRGRTTTRERVARTVGLASAVSVAAVLAAAVPATAAPPAATSSVQAGPNVSMQCDSGARTVICSVSYLSTSPVQIRWTLRGTPISGFDNLTQVQLGCSGPVDIGVWVTNADGTGSTGRLVYCNPGEWP